MRKIVLVCLVGATSAVGFSQFHVLVTESVSGSVGPSQWGGIRRFNFAGTGASAVAATGISASLLSDPVGLAFAPNGELFVGNRHGNSAASSMSRFTYDGGTDTYTANGTVTGNSLFGTHGLAFSSAGDLFATNVNGPISRFSMSGNTVTAAGTIASGPSRDAFVSANGQWLYVTEGVSGNLLKYSVATGNLHNIFTITGAAGLHNGSWRGQDLYLAGFGSNTVHRVSFDANGDIAGDTTVAFSSTAISLAFSPDAQEMFVAGHTSGQIERFLNQNGNWVSSGTIVTGVNMGDITVVPEPGTIAALGLGLAALARRRRSRA